MEEKNKPALIGIGALVALIVVIVIAINCAPKPEQENTVIAATVNGAAIDEADVTREIETRRADMGLSDAVAWERFLESEGMLPDDFRMQVIEEMVDDELIRQGSVELGVGPDGLSPRESARAYFRDHARLDGESGEEMLGYLAERYDGAKRSSHILIKVGHDDGGAAKQEARQKAEGILADIKSGAMAFDEAALTASDDLDVASKGGDMGWDCDTALPDAYQEVLDGLSAGEVSDVIEGELGFHIIMCTESCNLTGPVTSIDQFPASIRELTADTLLQMIAEDAYAAWLDGLRSSASIQINPMPDGVPYAPGEGELERFDDEGFDQRDDDDRRAGDAESDGSGFADGD
jgi:foldase protein PrsA